MGLAAPEGAATALGNRCARITCTHVNRHTHVCMHTFTPTRTHTYLHAHTAPLLITYSSTAVHSTGPSLLPFGVFTLFPLSCFANTPLSSVSQHPQPIPAGLHLLQSTRHRGHCSTSTARMHPAPMGPHSMPGRRQCGHPEPCPQLGGTSQHGPNLVGRCLLKQQ